ncbi:UDP-2,4-diacetamido-2,4,6-trideoxy-beta-L-altropyranose hydrolase [Virgibacillus halodenitrificans]|uniref:UDP-2,4-diacetamido-2,4, 6-trideoxy-beta-L-altropyranose hydrolase n=1 Tax=Virgibacillus halodenitrificans TaxID=1482 RepID=UPI001FB3FD11|nr:UDP-2,4-diacetamido-2,4,6-trideoxy-beta-L-altropyranose hydrolase [Virgibacillus halodenitrificans]MCJ0929756.1 UDP-2,4-diacetamido-2,4,6-trideoxy-beta-L-altropyranose hydrolase [Virgibacillus halodenitrificans]
MRVLIFTEGGRQRGLGHISRCSSLYDEIEERGMDVEFIINGDLDHYQIIKDKRYKVVNWLSEDYLTTYIKKSDYCIVDSYLANEALCQLISHSAKKALFIDDNGRINYPEGIVVNPSLSKEAVTYPKKATSCYLVGPEYIILRSSFKQVKREYINPSLKNVMITLGGSDIHNLTPLILEHLVQEHPTIVFHVIIGTGFGKNGEINKYLSKNVILYHQASAEEMKAIMVKSDLAITAAGQTIYELLATQTPFIPIKVVENQNNNIAGLKEYKLIETVLEYDDLDFLGNLKKEVNNLSTVNMRSKLVSRYENVVDGLGNRRIIDKMISS